MSDYKLIPFHSEHLKVMDMRAYEKEFVYPYLPQAFLDHCSMITHNYTAVKDGRIITCVGFLPVWPGVYEVWQIPSVYVERHTIEYGRDMRRLLVGIAKELKARRIQTFSPSDELHDRWMSFLGFDCEGVLREYNRFRHEYKIWSRLWAQP